MTCTPSATTLLVACVLASAVSATEDRIAEGRIAESALRHFATNKVLPEYTADAIRQHQSGVAVARVRISEVGRHDVRVLESPAPSIEAAVVDALRRWQFPPMTDQAGKPKRTIGKLTFYFVIKDGKGLVLNPDDAGYVGKWPSGSQSTNSPVVDVRDRDIASADPLPGAIRMPLDEIESRAAHELPKDAAIAVHCADAAHECLVGVQIFKMLGFDRVGTSSRVSAKSGGVTQ